MDFDIQALENYTGILLVNGVQIPPNSVSQYLHNLGDQVVTIDMIPGINQIIVQPWMTNINSLYNFHISTNQGRTMPCTVMYGTVTEYSDKLYFAQLSVLPQSPVCWQGYIPKSAVIQLGVI